jgi:hypothetical protein
LAVIEKGDKIEQSLVPVEAIASAILVLRGQRVILDADLARLYGVTTKRPNQAVKRNAGRFPADFVFQLTDDEKSEVVTNCDRFSTLKHSTSFPHAFTEHGALMAASVLNTPRAVEVSVYVVRAFIKLREILYSHWDLAHKLDELASRVDRHDQEIEALIEAIRELLAPPDSPSRRLGFRLKERRGRYYINKGSTEA